MENANFEYVRFHSRIAIFPNYVVDIMCVY